MQCEFGDNGHYLDSWIGARAACDWWRHKKNAATVASYVHAGHSSIISKPGEEIRHVRLDFLSSSKNVHDHACARCAGFLCDANVGPGIEQKRGMTHQTEIRTRHGFTISPRARVSKTKTPGTPRDVGPQCSEGNLAARGRQSVAFFSCNDRVPGNHSCQPRVRGV